MSATHYSFNPTLSRLAQRWCWACLIVFALIIVFLPQRFAWQWLLQVLMLGFICWEWWPWRSQSEPPFTIDSKGAGRCMESGERFWLSSRCRLLPTVVLLHSEQLGWRWLWKDSLDDTSWRRLCRIALKAQRVVKDDGVSTVGSDDGSRSG